MEDIEREGFRHGVPPSGGGWRENTTTVKIFKTIGKADAPPAKAGTPNLGTLNLTAGTRRRGVFSHERTQKRKAVGGRAVPTPSGVATTCRQREWGWVIQ